MATLMSFPSNSVLFSCLLTCRYEGDVHPDRSDSLSRLNSLCNGVEGVDSMIGQASPCTDSTYKGARTREYDSDADGDGDADADGEGGDSPPPPPPSLPPSPKAIKTDNCGIDDDADTSHITVEELKRWVDLGLTLKFLTVLKRTNNHSQLHAIHSSMCNPGFTLVQGPPGTGKTSTILGILNAFHIREYDRYYKMAVEVFLGEEGVRCRESKDAAPWYDDHRDYICILCSVTTFIMPFYSIYVICITFLYFYLSSLLPLSISSYDI